MTTITNEIRKDIDGTIERFEDMGEFDLLLVSRDCPYCHSSWEQPVLHVAVHRSGSTTYICPRCSSYYYFVGDKIIVAESYSEIVNYENSTRSF